jgi:hypothetical protein
VLSSYMCMPGEGQTQPATPESPAYGTPNESK